MAHFRRLRRLADAYRFAGFRPLPSVAGIFGDSDARVITLSRRAKKRRAEPAGVCMAAGTTARPGGSRVCPSVVSPATLIAEARRAHAKGGGQGRQECLPC